MGIQKIFREEKNFENNRVEVIEVLGVGYAKNKKLVGRTFKVRNRVGGLDRQGNRVNCYVIYWTNQRTGKPEKHLIEESRCYIKRREEILKLVA